MLRKIPAAAIRAGRKTAADIACRHDEIPRMTEYTTTTELERPSSMRINGVVRPKITATAVESQRRIRRRRNFWSLIASLNRTMTVRPFLNTMVLRDGMRAISRLAKKFANTPTICRPIRPARPPKRWTPSTRAVRQRTTTDELW